MSFILDALKKSDMQARQGELPSIHSSHAATSGSGHRSNWQYVLFGCAASGFVLAAAYFLLPGTTDHIAQTSTTAQPEPSPLPATIQQTAPPAVQMPVANTAPPPARPPAAQTGTTPPATQAALTEPGIQTVASVTRPNGKTLAPPAQPPSPSGTQSEAQVALAMPEITIGSNSTDNAPPLRNKLPLTVQQALPPIDISGHIFDEQPNARMVFINGHIQREGDNISPDLRLLAITPTGVELSFRDTPFRISLFQSRSRSDN